MSPKTEELTAELFTGVKFKSRRPNEHVSLMLTHDSAPRKGRASIIIAAKVQGDLNPICFFDLTKREVAELKAYLNKAT